MQTLLFWFFKLSQEKQTTQQLKQKLDTCEQELRVAVKSCDHIQVELDSTRREHKSDMSATQLEVDRYVRFKVWNKSDFL